MNTHNNEIPDEIPDEILEMTEATLIGALMHITDKDHT